MEDQTMTEPVKQASGENTPVPVHDIVREKLLTDLKNAGDALLSAINAFDVDQFNTKPFEGCWSAAQVADHLLKANGGVVHVVNGPVKNTHRSPMQHDPEMRKIFLDFSSKMQSPVEILPGTEPIEKATSLNNTRKVSEGLLQAARELDLSQTCTMAEFPGIGYLTRLEWLYFGSYHTLRHTDQLKKVFEQFS